MSAEGLQQAAARALHGLPDVERLYPQPGGALRAAEALAEQALALIGAAGSAPAADLDDLDREQLGDPDAVAVRTEAGATVVEASLAITGANDAVATALDAVRAVRAVAGARPGPLRVRVRISSIG